MILLLAGIAEPYPSFVLHYRAGITPPAHYFTHCLFLFLFLCSFILTSCVATFGSSVYGFLSSRVSFFVFGFGVGPIFLQVLTLGTLEFWS